MNDCTGCHLPITGSVVEDIDGLLWCPSCAITKGTETEQLRVKVLASKNIWTAIEQITEKIGVEAGRHLETLLCKEIDANLPPRE